MTAGFYFNNALFRLAAVYHRSLKVVTGNEEKSDVYVKALLTEAQKRFEKARQRSWDNDNIGKIYNEVNGLKHTARGVFDGERSCSIRRSKP